MRDILAQLARPGRDPREDLPAPVFKQGVLKLEDLAPGMELTGTVLNVVDFGCFVDIGMHDSGLVHVSRLADRFIRDPHEFVAVGDVVKVWVMEVDKERRRVSLTMVRPGSERPRRPGPCVGRRRRFPAGHKQVRTRRAGIRREVGGSMAIVRRGAAKVGRVDAPTASRASQRINKAGVRKADGHRVDVRKAAVRRRPSRQGGRRSVAGPQHGGDPQGEAAPAASPAKIVAAMAVRRSAVPMEHRGRKVPVRAALTNSRPSPSRSSRSPTP